MLSFDVAIRIHRNNLLLMEIQMKDTFACKLIFSLSFFFPASTAIARLNLTTSAATKKIVRFSLQRVLSKNISSIISIFRYMSPIILVRLNADLLATRPNVC